MSFEDLVRYVFKEANLEYLPDLPAGLDPKLSCGHWFNFWAVDPDLWNKSCKITNEVDFQECLMTYA